MVDRVVSVVGLSVLLILVLMLNPGCSPAELRSAGLLSVSSQAPQTPAVQATEGSSASLMLTTCMITVGGGGQTLTDIIQMLTTGGVLVSASGGGSARLAINNCPHPIDAPMIREIGQALRTSRVR